jgi:hypothetical protein
MHVGRAPPNQATEQHCRTAHTLRPQATRQATISRRSSIRPMNCGNEPPWGVEPQTYALREIRSSPPRCPPGPSAHVKPLTVRRRTRRVDCISGHEPGHDEDQVANEARLAGLLRCFAVAGLHTPPRPSRPFGRRRGLGSRKWTTRNLDALTSLTAQQADPVLLTGRPRARGQWRRRAGSVTSPSTRTAPRSAPATHPRSRSAWATLVSAALRLARRHQHRRRSPPSRP